MTLDASQSAAELYRASRAAVPIRAIALVPSERVSLLQQCGATACIIECSVSTSDLIRRIEAGPHGVVVLDPLIIRADALQKVVDVVYRAGRRLILHTALTNESARLVTTIAGTLPAEVVFHMVQNESALLSEHLMRIVTPSIPAQVMTHVARGMKTMPPALATVITGLFCWMPIPRRVQEFVSATAMERRSVERALRRAGFRGANALLVGARLARTWSALEQGRLRMSGVAALGGFQSPRTLGEHFRRIAGTSPRAAVMRLSPATFASLLGQSLLAPSFKPISVSRE